MDNVFLSVCGAASSTKTCTCAPTGRLRTYGTDWLGISSSTTLGAGTAHCTDAPRMRCTSIRLPANWQPETQGGFHLSTVQESGSISLPKRKTDPGYHFDEEVELDYYRLQKISEGSISLGEGVARPLDEPREVGTGMVRDEDVPLSRLIDISNESPTLYESAKKASV